MSSDSTSELDKLAAEYGVETDPLAKHDEKFKELDIDPFEPVMSSWIESRDLDPKTERGYRRTFKQWSEFMHKQGRHPALPNGEHVAEFLRHQVRPESEGGRGNSTSTAKNKWNHLRTAFEFWQSKKEFPHGMDYNPLRDGREMVNLDSPSQKTHRYPKVEELRDWFDGVTHIRRLAIILSQFKLAMRAGEVRNLQIQDINLRGDEIRKNYPELGTHPMVEDRPNAIYIAPKQDDELPVPGRYGNKSKRPRILPLDDELRKVFRQYLLIRPQVEHDEVFLTRKTNGPITHSKPIVNAWINAFGEERLEETEFHREIRSHYGRHYFTSFMYKQDVERQKVKYMRGDVPGDDNSPGKESIDHYLHYHYEDVRDLYLENIFKLRL